MNKEIELIRYVRSNILKLTSGLSIEQLNRIPEKFNNNIAWNLAHLVITQQNMGYKLGGIEVNPDMAWFNDFAPGTKPNRELSEHEVATVKRTLISAIDQFEEDYKKGIFEQYVPWTLHGVMDVSDVTDAAKIICVHEGRHYGVITSLLKLVA